MSHTTTPLKPIPRKAEVKQDFMSAKVQNLAQAMFALSVATLTFSTSYTQARLAAKLQV